MRKVIDPVLIFSISLLVIYKLITEKPRCGYSFTKQERFLLFLKMSAQFLRGFKEIYTMKLGYKIQKKIQ